MLNSGLISYIDEIDNFDLEIEDISSDDESPDGYDQSKEEDVVYALGKNILSIERCKFKEKHVNSLLKSNKNRNSENTHITNTYRNSIINDFFKKAKNYNNCGTCKG